jgi:cystathionine beta-synthase
MQKALPIVPENEKLEVIKNLFDKDTPAVLVKLNNGKHNIITRYDMINAL